MPVQVNNIDEEIAYILLYWIQNNNQAITGTIGQNVVYNLAQFIKQNPENYVKASVVADAVINYTTNPSECYIVFTNNSTGEIDFGNNIWNKWCFINQTANTRDISGGKFYYDLAGTAKFNIPPYTSVAIVKGKDDFWYAATVTANNIKPVLPPLIGIVDRGQSNDPVSGTSIYQNDLLIGLGATNDGNITIVLDGANLTNWGINQSIGFNSASGTINLDFAGSGNQWQTGSGLSVDLNQ